MTNPVRLECPVCNGSIMYYLKRAGVYRCRRCGSEFSVTKTVKGLRYKVVYSPLTTVKEFEKEIVKNPKKSRR